MENTMMIYKTAKVIRNSITKFAEEKEEADMIAVSSTRDDIPADLYSLIQWILVGPEEELQTDVRSRAVNRPALSEYNVCLQNQETSAALAMQESF